MQNGVPRGLLHVCLLDSTPFFPYFPVKVSVSSLRLLLPPLWFRGKIFDDHSSCYKISAVPPVDQFQRAFFPPLSLSLSVPRPLLAFTLAIGVSCRFFGVPELSDLAIQFPSAIENGL